MVHEKHNCAKNKEKLIYTIVQKLYFSTNSRDKRISKLTCVKVHFCPYCTFSFKIFYHINLLINSSISITKLANYTTNCYELYYNYML